jgi:hypothetical protein
VIGAIFPIAILIVLNRADVRAAFAEGPREAPAEPTPPGAPGDYDDHYDSARRRTEDDRYRSGDSGGPGGEDRVRGE